MQQEAMCTQYTRHKYIEHDSSKPIIITIITKKHEGNMYRQECTYTSGRDRVLQKVRTRAIYFENILQAEDVHI